MNTIRSWLWIGKYRDSLNTAMLAHCKINAMLQLAQRFALPGIRSLYLPVEDGETVPVAHLHAGIAFIHESYEQSETLLIACGAGMSRSALFAIIALKEIEGVNLLDAACMVKQAHPITMPHVALWDSACAYYGEDISFLELLRVFRTLEG